MDLLLSHLRKFLPSTVRTSVSLVRSAFFFLTFCWPALAKYMILFTLFPWIFFLPLFRLLMLFCSLSFMSFFSFLYVFFCFSSCLSCLVTQKYADEIYLVWKSSYISNRKTNAFHHFLCILSIAAMLGYGYSSRLTVWPCYQNFVMYNSKSTTSYPKDNEIRVITC